MAGDTMSRLKFWISWLVHDWTACQTNIPGMPFAVLPKPMRITHGSRVIRAVLHRGGHWAATESKNLRIGRALPAMAGYQFLKQSTPKSKKVERAV